MQLCTYTEQQAFYSNLKNHVHVTSKEGNAIRQLEEKQDSTFQRVCKRFQKYSNSGSRTGNVLIKAQTFTAKSEMMPLKIPFVFCNHLMSCLQYKTYHVSSHACNDEAASLKKRALCLHLYIRLV